MNSIEDYSGYTSQFVLIEVVVRLGFEMKERL